MTLQEKLKPIVAEHGIYSVLGALVGVMEAEADEHHKNKDYDREQLAKRVVFNIEQARDAEL